MSVEDLEDMKDQMDEIKVAKEELNNFVKDYATDKFELAEEELERHKKFIFRKYYQ